MIPVLAGRQLSTKRRARGRRPPLYRRGPGHCSWCGKSLYSADGTLNKRRKWHPGCLREYKLHAWSGWIRRRVYARDRGICAVCGTRGPWNADHIIELADVPKPHKIEDRQYWGLGNLQTLCVPHHKEKSKLATKARTKARRS